MKILNVFNKFQKAVSISTSCFALLYIFIQVFELILSVVESFSRRYAEIGGDYAPAYGKTMAVLFLSILLMLAVNQIVKTFSYSEKTKLQVILIVCITSLCGSILRLHDLDENPVHGFSLATLIFSLTVGYSLIENYWKSLRENGSSKQNNNTETKE